MCAGRLLRTGAVVLVFFITTYNLQLTTVFAAEELAALQAAFLRENYDGVVREIRSRGQDGRMLSDGMLYLWGVSALKLDRPEEGRQALERLITEYPASPWRAQTQEILQLGTFTYCVQVGSFSSERNAERLSAELKRRGFPSEISEGVLGGKTFFRVRVGRFGSRAEAGEELKRLKREGFPGRIFP